MTTRRPNTPPAIFTAGHSTCALADLIPLVRARAVATLVDVR